MNDLSTIRMQRLGSPGLALTFILGAFPGICRGTICHAGPPGLETLPGQSPSQSNEENARAASRDGAIPAESSGGSSAPEGGPAPVEKAPRTEEAPMTIDGSNPIFAFTHLLPSPLTLPAGRLEIGSGVAYGLFGWAQVGTDLVGDIYQIFNLDAKVKLIDYPRFTLGADAVFETFNYQSFNSANPDLRVNAWLPGLTLGYEVAPRLAVFVGANLNVTHEQIPSVLQTSGYVHGAQLETDVSYAYNPPPESGYLGNVVAAGYTYDMTYRISGIGISHYWRGFKLGIHYYLNANQDRILPIIGVGTVVDF